MTLRVDLYPVKLSRLNALLDGGDEAQALAAEMRKARPADGALLDALLSGRVRASHPDAESALLASLVGRVAYQSREPEPGVLFDCGGVWNAFDQLSAGRGLGRAERQLARALLAGRPLLGDRIDSDGTAYSWIRHDERAAFAALLHAAKPGAGFMVAEVEAFRAEVEARGLDIFVSIG